MRPYLRLAAAIALAALALPAPSAWAWSRDGHRTTAYFADPLLSPVARRELAQLMGSVDLPAWSTWMDEQRDRLKREVPGSDAWHYDNRPVCDAKALPPSWCRDGDCASEQVDRLQGVLADPESPVEARQQAVRFLVHMVGDVHQPLHAGDNGDRGGNQVRVTLVGPLYPTNLHAVWDGDLVQMTLWKGTRAARRPEALVRGNARDLRERYAREIPRWQRGTVTDWMRESYQLARDVTYGALPGFRCGAPPVAQNAPPLRLPAAYVEQSRAVVPRQLARAGARIAYVLNTTLETAARRRQEASR